jgi:hypothetical protein
MAHNLAFLPSDSSDAGRVDVTLTTDTKRNVVHGVCTGTGVEFKGPLDGKAEDYVVTVNAPASGITGTLTIHSVSNSLPHP